MTLIAIAVKGDYAEILSDSSRYNLSLSFLGSGSKVAHYTHLDTAIVGAGDAVFNASVKANADLVKAGGFDELMSVLPETLPRLWDRETHGRHGVAATQCVVGYSETAGQFRAFAMASDHDFEPLPFTQLCLPMPWSFRPSDLELARMRADDYLPPGPNRETNLAMWAQQPEWPMPGNDEAWIALAQLVREQRALEEYGRVIVAGKVHLAQIQRGAYLTRVVHQFADEGEELERLLAGTFHPTTQVAPCWCGSGEPAIHCHMVELLDQPCPCSSSQTFRECCAVPADEHPA